MSTQGLKQPHGIIFSIVIPARNEELNITRCLDSITAMPYEKEQYEIIVVDNGSSDRTVDIALEHGARTFSKPDLTISGLRNFGARHSSGEILAFLDADCAVTAHWLSAASRYRDDVEVAAFGSPVIVPDGGTWVQKAWFNIRGKPGQVTDVEWLESANLFVRRAAFFSVGGFDESLATCEDYDLTQRLKTAGRLVSDHRVMAIHYREPATVMEFIRKEMWRGKDNYTGLFRRKVSMAELPSLLLPVLSLLLVIGSLFYLVMLVLGRGENFILFPASFLLWQITIVLFSHKKNKSGKVSTVLQLMLLFNAYFMARGLAVLRRT